MRPDRQPDLAGRFQNRCRSSRTRATGADCVPGAAAPGRNRHDRSILSQPPGRGGRRQKLSRQRSSLPFLFRPAQGYRAPVVDSYAPAPWFTVANNSPRFCSSWFSSMVGYATGLQLVKRSREGSPPKNVKTIVPYGATEKVTSSGNRRTENPMDRCCSGTSRQA